MSVFHDVTDFMFLSFFIRRKFREKLFLEGKIKTLTLHLIDSLWGNQ